ncbi:hypothetical protein BKA67DRAFT_553030 [Truncatella angustata]|uniref:Uncharacterized protein n=1 Tax=Truncatella angustata TaxID=152316 RepID=A0A9P8UPX0_9PEZI|nr:uncharacterized protein BKA67DRAFT_553030 [Truncatella angustata]KAH6656770.1 hypothetical protein BKA67DRAFT_553030 [Truncatella angustata]
MQCLSYVPKDADPDLLRSIDAWKSEWSALKRNKTRKKGEDVAAQRLSSPVPRSSRQQFLRHHAAE